MAKNRHMGLRYFILSFLITFSVITVIGFFVLARVLDPSPVQNTTDGVKKNDHIFTDSDSITVLCIGYSRKDPQTAYYSIVRLDAPAQRIFVTSIPDDTVISDLVGRKTLIETASYGGSAALADKLSEVLDIPIDRWLRIEEESFAALVDELGAVTYDCKSRVEHYDQNGFMDYSMSEGRHIFFGDKLCGLIKYSGNDGTSRANEQTDILCSLFSQRISEGKYTDVQTVFELLMGVSESSITAFDLETRRYALEQITQDKTIICTAVPFSLDADGKPSEDYLDALGVYR